MTETLAMSGTLSQIWPHVEVLSDRCAGCQECLVRCPTGAITMDERRWVVRVDDAACVGCRQCVRTCPFGAIEVSGSLILAERCAPALTKDERESNLGTGATHETRPGFASFDEALVEASRCLSCPDPTCVRGCPAHNDIPGFIAALREGDLDTAHQVLRRTSVLPDICSRVCNQSAQCEGACTWSLAGGAPVAIGLLERFITDNLAVAPPDVPAERTPRSVAVVGSGPAGIGAAWELVEAGLSVTVYERGSVPGGLCDWGIPDFTLPREVAERPWRQLIDAGVELRFGEEIHADNVERLLGTHDAVILAYGASVPQKMPIPGAELEGVTDATRFLVAAKDALRSGMSAEAFGLSFGIAPARESVFYVRPRVLVLGAGNTAMDVARSARRLGLEAICIDWLDERFALARKEELAEAREDGVEIKFSRTCLRLAGRDGRVSYAELSHTRQERRDHLPRILDDPPEIIDVDLVVMAMGYRIAGEFASVVPYAPIRKEATGIPDRHWMASGILAGPASLAANSYLVGRLALGREVGFEAAARSTGGRIFVAGDALVGPSSVVEAMAQGRRAAREIIETLS